MEPLNLLVTLFVAAVPAAIVCIACVYTIKSFLQNDRQKETFNVKFDNHKTTFPLRLQAYERLIIFLERIKINSIVMRVYQNGMDAQYFQAELLRTIRNEFEHNLSQQLYVGDTAWQLVVFSKEETIQMLNLASKTVREGTSATDFSKTLFELNAGIEKHPTDEAIKYLKAEMRKFF